jgi:hypothetical protein
MNPKFWFATSLAVIALAILGPVSVSAEIFRTVDEDGNVVFSDIPPSPDQTSESVTVDPVNTFEAPAVAAPRAGSSADVEVPEVESYNSVTILAPANDTTVRENAGNVTVAVAVDPSLRAGDRLVLYMDGKQSQVRAQGTSFRLENMDRGTHTIGVRVLDDAGNVAAEAATSTFTLQRVSISRPRPSPT